MLQLWPVRSHADTLSQTGRFTAIQTSWLVSTVRRQWTERREKPDGKLTLDQDFTHPGLHTHHSTLIHLSVIKSSWDSSSPNDTAVCVIQDHQDHRDHRESPESSGSPGSPGSPGSSGSSGSPGSL